MYIRQDKSNKKQNKPQLNPPQILALGFLALIIIGGVLLKLPIATHESISWIDAFFTATSATTVTGLYVVDTNSTFTLFGEFIILALIQIGGLGFMTFAILIVLILGKRIGLRQRMIIQEQLQTSLGGIIKLVKRLVIFSLIIEGIGIFLLSVRWIPELGFWKGLYFSLFHIVAAFNNAGFALWQDNLSQFVGDPIVNIVITLMIITGGLGFTVLNDMWYSKDFHSLTLHSKLMITGTIIINIIAVLTIFLLEFNNPKTLAGLPPMDQWWASYFQGVTTRTAGFNTVPIEELQDPTVLFMCLLMFIGAGSVSTGGGIKLTTFIIILFAVGTFVTKNKKNPIIYKKRIDVTVVYRALAIVISSLTAIFIAVFILTISEKTPFFPLLFEVVSAFGTVGLSMGVTGTLSLLGKLIIMFMMYLGLIGPLTIMLSLADRGKEKIRYPEEDVFTG